MFVGRRGPYQWIEYAPEELDLHGLLVRCPFAVLGRWVVVSAFDSGPPEPSAEERAAGWTHVGDLTISPRVRAIEDLPRGEYDGWYVFTAPPPATLTIREVFVDDGRFSMARPGSEGGDEQLRRFWLQLESLGAESFLGEGCPLFFVTKNAPYFDQVRSLTSTGAVDE